MRLENMFNQKGFLNLDTNREITERIRNSNKTEYDFVMKLNEYIYHKYDSLDNSNIPDRQISKFIIATIIEMHKTFQAIIIMLEMGLQNEAKALLRILLEKQIKLQAVHNDKANYHKLRQNEIHIYKQIAKNIENGNIKYIPNDNITENFKKIIDLESKKIQIHELAKLANMETEYYTMYNKLNENVHHGIYSSYGTTIIGTDENAVTTFNILPITSDIREYIQSVVDLMIRGTEIFLEHFDFDKTDLERLYQEEIRIWGAEDETIS
jgi:hypothetical protein